MTEGHTHRTVTVTKGGLLYRLLTRPLWTTTNLRRVDPSPYPYGVLPERPSTRPMPPQPTRYYLSALSILHRWTGLTLYYETPDEGTAEDQ
jgi:hypothetical protein